jgi:hypothetical protein
MSKAENSRCLLLNADYTPLKLISWQKAITWSLKYNDNHKYSIEIIEYYKDKYIQGTNDKKYALPLIAKTIKYFNIYERSLKFSRSNLFIRDNYTCQYCGKIFSYNELTYDHIVPKSHFISNKQLATNWHNITTACIICNRKKSNKTPEQAKMKLLNAPKKPYYEPRYLPIMRQLLSIKDTSDLNHKEWIKYINGHF